MSDWSPAENLYAVAVSEARAWMDTIDLTARRMRSGDPFEQQLDARLFLLALRQLLYAADLEARVIKVLAPSARTKLRAARASFKSAVPGLTDARNVLVHFDEYARGAGDLQRKLTREGADVTEVARDYWPFGYDPGTGMIQLGPFQIQVENARLAARQLCHAIWMAAREVDAQGVDGR
jgi:hypothetical protein